MARLSVTLPPFSPDYSGVASTFFDLNAIAVLHDASGCTANYTGYDEPRWYGSNAPIYCSGLREIDAVLGDDDKLIKKVLLALEDIRADMLVVIGSPVPMVVGFDARGVAAELESLTGLPSFGFDTTGTLYYDWGSGWASRALIERFCERREKKKKAVNILGLNAIDFPAEDEIKTLIAIIESSAAEVNATFPIGLSLEAIKDLARAEVNIVVSASGLAPAELMRDKYGIPYIVGLPYGEHGRKMFFSRLERAFEAREEEAIKIAKENGDVLILGEAVSSLSLAETIEKDCGLSVRVSSIFSHYKELETMGDINILEERDMKKALDQKDWALVIADPLLKALLRRKEQKFLSLPSYAVSSKLSTQDQVNRFSPSFYRDLESLLEK